MKSNQNKSDRFQFSLASAFIVMTLFSLAAMALRSGDWLWARVIFSLTLAILLAAILGIVYRTGVNRAFWLGFAIFGWTYLLLAFTPAFRVAEHHLFGKQVHSYLKDYSPEASSGIVIDSSGSRIAVFSFAQIIYSLSAWLFGLIGGFVGVYFFWIGKKQTPGGPG